VIRALQVRTARWRVQRARKVQPAYPEYKVLKVIPENKALKV
jgi:hypothetical protein